MFQPTDYLDLQHTEHRILLEQVTYVWEALPKIKEYLQLRLKPANLGTLIGKPFIGKNVFIGKGTVIEEGAMIKGPAWIGEGCELRKGCYLRENVIIGNGVVVGNSSEIKNALVFDEAQIPHFNYVGDSILGFRAHLGAGAILSNVRLDRANIMVMADSKKMYPFSGLDSRKVRSSLEPPRSAEEGQLLKEKLASEVNGYKKIATGLKKFGAVLGDRVEVGCNAVLSPGSIIGRDSMIYPNTSWYGTLPEQSVGKTITKLHIERR